VRYFTEVTRPRLLQCSAVRLAISGMFVPDIDDPRMLAFRVSRQHRMEGIYPFISSNSLVPGLFYKTCHEKQNFHSYNNTLSTLNNSPCRSFLLRATSMDSSSSSQQHTNSQKDLVVSSETNIKMVSQESNSPFDSQMDATVAEDSSKLPRVDRGRDAWLFLVGCFVFEALVWGKPL